MAGHRRRIAPNTLLGCDDDNGGVCVLRVGSDASKPVALATRLGEGIADRGWTLVSGGGNVSAMGALAAGARARAGRTVGVIPKALCTASWRMWTPTS